MYHFVERLRTLYELLQDEQSKEIFQARFALDMEYSIPNIKRLASAGGFKDQANVVWDHPLKETLKKLNRDHKKIILYGTAFTGRLFAEALQMEHIGFYGFCGQSAQKFPNGLMGKPVLTPDELAAHGDEYYVVLTVTSEKACTEILQFLRKSNYPENHILPDRVDMQYVSFTVFGWEYNFKDAYFDFPELYHRGTAFIDGGCLDCKTSRRFAEWCGGEYSSIIAFEPDPGSYSICCEKMREVPLPNFQLVNAGLSSQEGTAAFDAQGSASSRIMTDRVTPGEPGFVGDEILVRTVAIDDIVGDRTVGFIKMDIEGAELDALHGAKNTILRDKPLLAICVYHLQGDLFAIMDYLHQLLPEYRFLLRQYTSWLFDTVLYASVDL